MYVVDLIENKGKIFLTLLRNVKLASRADLNY